MKKIYIVTDLGPGDGGKGGVVHCISHMMRAHTILKAGGAQGSHGVCTSSGENFAFSQWGCGTFEGVRTHLTPRMVMSPEALLNEANDLRYRMGIHDPFGLLTVDELCLCATPYHGIASRLKELARGSNHRGTIGSGVGDAVRDQLLHPDEVIRARDLSHTGLRDRLAAIRDRKRSELQTTMESDILPQDQKLAQEECALLNDPGFLDHIVHTFQEVSRYVRFADLETVLARDGVGVLETSHGVLTDNHYGFHPHTSAIRTLPAFNQAMLREAGYEGDIVNIGVSRAYGIRHGAGPMPTADPALAECLLPGSSKEENRYQGKVRVGALDLVLLRYALDVCGGSTAFDGLAITWFDQIVKNGVWNVCDRYLGTDDETLFTPAGTIKVYDGPDNRHTHQERLGKALLQCRPLIESHEPSTQHCADLLAEKLGIRVRMISVGPTEKHKILY